MKKIVTIGCLSLILLSCSSESKTEKINDRLNYYSERMDDLRARQELHLDRAEQYAIAGMADESNAELSKADAINDKIDDLEDKKDNDPILNPQ